MQAGDLIELTIHDVAVNGGVARHQGAVIFVPWTIAGERVRARLKVLKKNFAEAELVDVIEPSPHRVEPRCPYFGTQARAAGLPLPCGGCQYQHIAYAGQLAIKKRQIIATLERIGGVAAPPVADVVGSPEVFGYRNKISMQADPRRQAIGFHATDHRTLLDIARCEIAAEPLNEALATYRAAPPPADRPYSFFLRLDSRGMVGAGNQVLEETVAGVTLRVSANSFFQANRFLTGALVELVRQRVTAAGHRHLLDAYCGVGLFMIALAPQLDAGAGIECDRQAVIWARKNAQALGHRHLRFLDGYVEAQLSRALELLPRENTTLLLDPPRAGLSDRAREAVCKAALPHVVYVSCDFGTFARDTKAFLASGYRLAGVQPVDMFPQTAHCEVVGEFKR